MWTTEFLVMLAMIGRRKVLEAQVESRSPEPSRTPD